MPTPREPTSAAEPRGARWEVRLLGGIEASSADERLGNFGSRSVAALLARLALYPQRSHAREELIELLWPGVALDVGRNRLRQAIFTLRKLLEPPTLIAAPVLVADRVGVRVVPDALSCDAVRFAAAARAGRNAEAVALYRGELLPGFYDDWIDEERLALAALFERASVALERQSDTATVRPAAPATVMAAPVPTGLPRLPIDFGHSTLPLYMTRFFGRSDEAARLRTEVLTHRLVTLLGPGGSGKTRLAVELAATVGAVNRSGVELLAAPFDVIAFVPLVNCSTSAQVVDALVANLHLHAPADDPLGALVGALADRRALLVLDNFEQVAAEAADVVAQLAARIPTLHLLVTSRRVLGLDGEREFAIEPLALPVPGAALHDAAESPAVALFVDRARAARADFHIGPSNVEAVIDLVHLVEGMPLAIELAAARVRSFGPAALAKLLRAVRAGGSTHAGQGLQLLARGGSRSALDPRHASMLRVIEWSWRLLDAAQARLLAALTVFHGGFTVEAAQAIGDEPAGIVALRLDELVASSLLRVQRGGSEDATPSRYAASEPVREYAVLQLDAAAARELRSRHRAWCTRWAESLPATPTLAEVRAEMPNLLAALASAEADAAPDEAIGLTLPLRRVLEDVELPAAGLASLEAAVLHCADPALQTRGHTLLAPLLFIAGRGDGALRHAEAALAGAPVGSPLRARALHAAARVRWRITRRPEGIGQLLDEAEALAAAVADLELEASICALRAFVANMGQDYAAGEALHGRALALWQQLGNRHAVNSGRYNLAVCAQNAGRQAQALQQLAEIEPSARALHDWRRLSQVLNVRGNALSALGLWPEAVASFRECIHLAWECMALHELAYGLWNLPRALAHVREPIAAATLATFAAEFWKTRFGPLGPADLFDLRRVHRLAARQLAAATLARLEAEGRQLTPAEAVARALRS